MTIHSFPICNNCFILYHNLSHIISPRSESSSLKLHNSEKKNCLCFNLHLPFCCSHFISSSRSKTIFDLQLSWSFEISRNRCQFSKFSRNNNHTTFYINFLDTLPRYMTWYITWITQIPNYIPTPWRIWCIYLWCLTYCNSVTYISRIWCIGKNFMSTL